MKWLRENLFPGWVSGVFSALLIVILVGVTLLVAWPVILIGAMLAVLSKGTDAWKRPRPSQVRGPTSDLVIRREVAG